MGEHSFEVTALHPITFNALGEEIELMYEPLPSIYTWMVVDTVAPDTFIDWGPPANSASTSAYFGVSSSDPAALVECSLDFEDFSECGEFGIAEYEELLDGDARPHGARGRREPERRPVPGRVRVDVTRGAPNTPAGQNVVVSSPPPR